MKEKILPILKNAVKNSTFSERTFSEVADSISKAATTAGITDDKLEAFVTDMLPVFSTFQGDANSQIADAVKKAKPSKKEEDEQKKDDKPKKEESSKEESVEEKIAKAVKAALEPVTQQLDSFKQASTKSALIQDAKKQLISQYKLDEKLCDKVIKRVDITTESTAEDIAKNALQEYNELATSFGLQGVDQGVPSSDKTPVPPSVKDIDDILSKM